MSTTCQTGRISYGLIIFSCGEDETFLRFATVEALACDLAKRLGYLHRLESRGYDLIGRDESTGVVTRYQAVGSHGQPLDVLSLLLWGRDLRDRRLRLRRQTPAGRTGGHQAFRGHGPVPGVRKSRGGRSYYRRVGTAPERRLNALVLKDEGEVAVRAARRGTNLPSSWDDILACREVNWKSQHKGRKSWDRQRQKGQKGQKRPMPRDAAQALEAAGGGEGV